MDALINPLVLYSACALGAVGVVLALPRRGASWRVPGALLAAAAGGIVVLALGLLAYDAEQMPNVYFYVFAALALGAGLRVITHHRPVYSALYFILTIIASAGLYVILAAEFMAFALIIIYAGAILITYLFVIMLATQAPVEGDEDSQPEYDARAREPAIATLAGFVLLAVLTTMMFGGLDSLREPPSRAEVEFRDDATLAKMPGKIERRLRRQPRLDDAGEPMLDEHGDPMMMIGEGEQLARMQITNADGSRTWRAQTAKDYVHVDLPDGGTRPTNPRDWPEDLKTSNVELVGWNLLDEHPGTIEIAGVILLMAMLGATVLSRRQVEIDEQAKAHEARRLHGLDKEGAAS